MLREVGSRFHQVPESANAILAVRRRKDLRASLLRYFDQEPPHVFHHGPMQPGIDLVYQQESLVRSLQRKPQREQTAQPVAVAADRHPAASSPESYQSSAAAPCAAGQEVDRGDFRHDDLHVFGDLVLAPLGDHVVPSVAHRVIHRRAQPHKPNRRIEGSVARGSAPSVVKKRTFLVHRKHARRPVGGIDAQAEFRRGLVIYVIRALPRTSPRDPAFGVFADLIERKNCRRYVLTVIRAELKPNAVFAHVAGEQMGDVHSVSGPEREHLTPAPSDAREC